MDALAELRVEIDRLSEKVEEVKGLIATDPLNEQQKEALRGAVSIASRMGRSYEVYGGVELQSMEEGLATISWL